MKKHALIITNEGVKGTESYLPGVSKDIENIKDYLMSPVGGAWNNDEISAIAPQFKPFLESALTTYLNYDYLMIFFSGHGYHNGTETIIELSHNNEVSEGFFRGRARKTLLILDCCRNFIPELLLDSTVSFKQASAGLSLNRSLCRKYYEEKIQSILNTFTTCYSCSEYQSSEDSSNKGGLYLYNLLKVARDKTNNTSIDLSSYYQVFSIREIHAQAKSIVMSKTRNDQIPDMNTQRLDTDFPMAILA